MEIIAGILMCCLFWLMGNKPVIFFLVVLTILYFNYKEEVKEDEVNKASYKVKLILCLIGVYCLTIYMQDYIHTPRQCVVSYCHEDVEFGEQYCDSHKKFYSNSSTNTRTSTGNTSTTSNKTSSSSKNKTSTSSKKNTSSYYNDFDPDDYDSPGDYEDDAFDGNYDAYDYWDNY